MPKIRPETAARRRSEILQAAHRSLNTHGMTVTVEQICVEAGVSKGTFYGYFESKDAVILAIAGEHGADILSLEQIDRADALASRLLSYGHRGNASSSRFELEAWTYSLSQPELRAIFQKNLGQLDRSIAQSLLHLKASDEVPSQVSTADAAYILRIFTAGMMATTAIGEKADILQLQKATGQLVRLLADAGVAAALKDDEASLTS